MYWWRTGACIALVLVAAVGAVGAAAPAQDDDVPHLSLWTSEPDASPGRITERSLDPRVPDRIIEDVRAPYIVVHAPARPSGVALLVTPGGGYARIVLDKEGTALLPAFVEAAGITLFVLRYRLPDASHAEGADAPLVDAQRAMRMIRTHASDYGVDPDRVGVMGFSAGGHVAARLATASDAAYSPRDAIDTHPWRPDFALLIYPVISLEPGLAHAGSRARLLAATGDAGITTRERLSPALHVSARTPPLFLLHAQDDEVVPVGNTLAIHAAALAAGAPASLHIFPTGGHGFGVRDAHGPLARWPRLAIDWIDALDTSP